MELSVFTKVKITLAIVVGVLIVGLLPWSMIKPDQPEAAVVFFGGEIELWVIGVGVVLAFAAGLLSAVLTRPYSLEIGVMAAPAGLCVYSLFSGSFSQLLRENSTLASRGSVYSMLRWEGFLWLVIPAAGFLAAFLYEKMFPNKNKVILDTEEELKGKFRKNLPFNIAAALVGSVVIAHIGLGAFARDVSINAQNAIVVSQPANLQIAFACFAAFYIAGFVVKFFLHAGYIWPALATGLVVFLEMYLNGKAEILEYLAKNWPIGFYLTGSGAVLPVQIVGWGCLGSVVGYWSAVRFRYWRKHSA